MKGLYKGRYGIGIYKKIRKVGDTDEMVELFDNAQQFAKFIGKSIRNVKSVLSNHFNGTAGSNVIIKGKEYELAFIDMLED